MEERKVNSGCRKKRIRGKAAKKGEELLSKDWPSTFFSEGLLMTRGLTQKLSHRSVPGKERGPPMR